MHLAREMISSPSLEERNGHQGKQYAENLEEAPVEKGEKMNSM